ncbi:MAG: hypothetical protein WC615_06730 [Mucilaginibacter sp.]|jgi:hypothetical protein|uniref:exosortase Y-associated Wzy-like protein n=1 Tax=Mucilaginibacter sp. TaxID=1882438 RepID=UPI003565711C
MSTKVNVKRFLALYLPWGLATLLQSDPVLSYFIAWAGSFFIFFITLSGWIVPLPTDLSLGGQLMRPIFLVHIIFAGYTCCTSIFYFFDLLGYQQFSRINDYYLPNAENLRITSECQRYYCLGHAALASGILCFMKYPVKHKYILRSEDISNLLFYFAIIALPVSVLFLKIPGLAQFANQFSSLSFIAGTLALAFAIPKRKVINTIICLILFFSNFYSALTSGFKEPIILSVLILGVFLYPNYKKIVLATFIPALLALFILLPTFANVIRANSWTGDTSADEATQLALDAAIKGDEQTNDTNWSFFAYRLSEMDMFTKFVATTPSKNDYYHEVLLKQSLWAVIPRLFWSGKPNTEDLVMQRVYDAEVVSPYAKVSAKPAFIVDAYLSFGGAGVWLFMFIYGAAAQLISLKAEQLFGGYLLGTALIFTGLFQSFWRGLSLEFFINTIFWSYVSMLIIHRIFISKKILEAD